MSFTLDGDDHLAVDADQGRVLRKLRTLGVADSLWKLHRRSEERRLLVREYQELRDDLTWKAIAPLYRRTWDELERAETALREAGLLWPDDADVNDLLNFLCAIAVPAQRLRCGYGGDPNAESLDPRAVRAARSDFRRQKFGKAGRRIGMFPATAKGLASFLAAVQQRFMPEMRRQTYQEICRAILRARKRARDVKTATAPNAFVDTRDIQQEACRLTAEFIQAFYPTFGRTTNIDNVRKAVCRAGNQRRNLTQSHNTKN